MSTFLFTAALIILVLGFLYDLFEETSDKLKQINDEIEREEQLMDQEGI